ncbi:hypothetical protein ACFQXA_21460 [Nocardiopsis composta]
MSDHIAVDTDAVAKDGSEMNALADYVRELKSRFSSSADALGRPWGRGTRSPTPSRRTTCRPGTAWRGSSPPWPTPSRTRPSPPWRPPSGSPAPTTTGRGSPTG